MAQARRDPLARAVVHHRRAIAARGVGRFDEAARQSRLARDLYAATQGPRHPDVANALYELGQVEEARERFPAAHRCYMRALALLRATTPARIDADIGRLRVSLGIRLAGVERALGRFSAADRGYRRAFADVERWLGPRDPDRAGLLNNWGMLRKYQGRFSEGIQLYQRALAIARANRDREALATLYHNLGGIEHARGRHAAGVPHARRSVALRAALHGSRSVAVATDVAALAALVDGVGRLDEAAALYQRALTVFRSKLGSAHSEVALTLSGLADVRQKQGRYPEAERLYRDALTILERRLGRGHAEVALTVHNLAHACREAGDLVGAERLYARALRTFERVLGLRHAHTRICRAAHEQVRRARRAARGPGAGGISS